MVSKFLVSLAITVNVVENIYEQMINTNRPSSNSCFDTEISYVVDASYIIELGNFIFYELLDT